MKYIISTITIMMFTAQAQAFTCDCTYQFSADHFGKRVYHHSSHSFSCPWANNGYDLSCGGDHYGDSGESWCYNRETGEQETARIYVSSTMEFDYADCSVR